MSEAIRKASALPSGTEPKKTCSKCLRLLSTALFYSNRAECKACYGSRVKACRAANPQNRQAADRRYRAKNRERQREHSALYVSRHPDRRAISRKAYRAANPLRRSAHNILNKAVRRGSVVKPEWCEICQSKPVEAHHDDYAFPLTVRWLCKRCHETLHIGISIGGKQRDALADALLEVWRDDEAEAVKLLAQTYAMVVDALRLAGRLPQGGS